MGKYFRFWYPFEYAEENVFIWGDDKGESVLTDNRRRLFNTSDFNIETDINIPANSPLMLNIFLENTSDKTIYVD